MSKGCIRVYADQQQIDNCKKQLEERDHKFKKLSQSLNLAGNEVRLKILFLLQEEEKMCPCDLSDILEMTVPAISQHLRKLKDAGLASHDRVGQTIFYSLDSKNASVIQSILGLLTNRMKTA